MSDLKVKLLLEAIDKLTEPIRRMTSKFIANMNKMSKKVADLGKAMTKLGTSMTLKLTTPLLALGGLAVRSSAKFEQLRASIKTMTGSQERANEEFERLLKFTASTPFQLEEVMNGYIKLVALGLDPSEEAMRSFGNTAAAMGKPLEQMVEAVADATTGEFERLKEFGIKTKTEGQSVIFTFQGVQTKVRKNADDIQGYLKTLGDVNFAGAMEDQMNTLNGAFSNLKDSVSSSLAIIGDELSETLEIGKFTKELSASISDLANKFKALPESVQGFIIKGGILLALLGPILIGFGQLIFALGMAAFGFSKLMISMIAFSGFVKATLIPGIIALALKIKLNLLGSILAASIAIKASLIPTIIAAAVAFKGMAIAIAMNPITWIVAGIVAVVAAGVLLIKNWTKVKEFWIGLWDALTDKVQSAVAFMQPLIDKISSGISALTDNRLTRGISKAKDFIVNGPADTSGINGTQKIDTGGELRVVVEDNRSARVSASMNNPQTSTTIDQGILMGGAL